MSDVIKVDLLYYDDKLSLNTPVLQDGMSCTTASGVH